MVTKKSPKKTPSKKVARKAVKVIKKKAPAKTAKKKTTKKTVKKDTSLLVHDFVPKHEKLSDTAKETILKKYNIGVKEIPKILITDPAIRHLEAKEGDVIEISRESVTAGEIKFYRSVVVE